MEAKEAINIAKSEVANLFADEQISNLGLEEIEFSDSDDAWNVTVGFSRPWHAPGAAVADLLGPGRRDYKVVKISDKNRKVISVKNRFDQ